MFCLSHILYFLVFCRILLYNATINKYQFKKKQQKYTQKILTTEPKTQFRNRILKNNEINYVKEFLGYKTYQRHKTYPNLKEKDVGGGILFQVLLFLPPN